MASVYLENNAFFRDPEGRAHATSELLFIESRQRMLLSIQQRHQNQGRKLQTASELKKMDRWSCLPPMVDRPDGLQSLSCETRSLPQKPLLPQEAEKPQHTNHDGVDQRRQSTNRQS
jgi:hypothetical protein